MRAAIKVTLAALILLLAAGIGLTLVAGVREAASRSQCQNNLKQIGLALQTHHDSQGHYPAGTVPNPDLPPDRRLSWVVHIYPSYVEGGVLARFDRARAWDDEANCPPRFEFPKAPSDWPEDGTERGVNLRLFLCPPKSFRPDPAMPSPTHYLGVAGLGDDAAALPPADPRCGLFGHDRLVTLKDVKDGSSVTLAVAEAADGGPWTAGGRATVRGLAVGGPPYLGEGGQFAAGHRTGPLSRRIVTNVLLVDGSVRPLAASVPPQVFEALATIAGGEEVGVPLD